MTHPRPRSPNVQIYRPQLTSVLSFGHRLSGVTLSISTFGLATWLVAAAIGPDTFSAVQALFRPALGQFVLVLVTLALFYHLCNGIRHLVWDSVRCLELRSIYVGGWTVVGMTLTLTLVFWIWVLS